MTTDTMIQIGAAVATLCGAIATIVAAVIASRSAAKVQRRTETIEQLKREHQERLAELNQSLTLAASLTQQRYSLKAQTLLDAYKIVGDVGYYAERSVVPYTVHVPMTKQQFIQKAEESFEALMRFRWQNGIYFPQTGAVSQALGNIMAGLNTISSTQATTQPFQQQAQQFIGTVEPALATIRDEFQAELKRSA